jgi:hypothetical protein
MEMDLSMGSNRNLKRLSMGFDGKLTRLSMGFDGKLTRLSIEILLEVHTITNKV